MRIGSLHRRWPKRFCLGGARTRYSGTPARWQVEAFPYGPICVFLILFVTWVVNLKITVVGKATAVRQYVGSLSIPLLANAVWAFGWWIAWTNQTPAGGWEDDGAPGGKG